MNKDRSKLVVKNYKFIINFFPNGTDFYLLLTTDIYECLVLTVNLL